MKLIRFFLFIFHLLLSFLLVGTLLNSVVPPKIFPYFNLLSLAFPVLMILHILLCLFWIFSFKKRAFFFLLISVVLFNPTRRWINFSPIKTEKPNLKIVTFNTHTGYGGFNVIKKYLETVNPDIAILQEVNVDAKTDFYKNQIGEYPILYLGTNLKVLKHERIDNTGTNGNCFYTDIEVNGQIIRVINVYLNPFSLEKDKVKPDQNIEDNKAKISYVLRKLIPTFKIHQNEVDSIHDFIKNSPYPVILAGDFNSVPNSYEYFTLGKGLQDAFVEAGNGCATSFHDYKFPIRIDYVFSSKEIKPISYRVDRSVKISDHFPVIAEFYVK